MISIRLAGGLGNQVFQLAAALLLSTKLNKPIKIDCSSLSSYKVSRNLMLNEIFDLDLVNIQFEISPIMRLYSRMRVARLGIIGCNDKSIRRFISKNNLSFFPIHLDGYFQDFWLESEFNYIVTKLKKLLRKDLSTPANRLVIHCRGGDFLEDSNLNILSLEWYKLSLTTLSKIEKIPDECVVVCEDSQQGELLVDYLNSETKYKFILKDIGTIAEDFFYIAESNFIISGNSTFAFWASVFGDKASCRIAPTHFSRKRKRLNVIPNEILIPINNRYSG